MRKKIAMRDVQEISFTDDMAAPGTFEFVINDWDIVTKAVKYSSPWNAQGQPTKLDGQTDAPNFEPGTRLELLFGYIGKSAIQPVMTGEVVSLSPPSLQAACRHCGFGRSTPIFVTCSAS